MLVGTVVIWFQVSVSSCSQRRLHSTSGKSTKALCARSMAKSDLQCVISLGMVEMRFPVSWSMESCSNLPISLGISCFKKNVINNCFFEIMNLFIYGN